MAFQLFARVSYDIGLAILPYQHQVAPITSASLTQVPQTFGNCAFLRIRRYVRAKRQNLKVRIEQERIFII